MSDNETTSKSKDNERLKNAERLARALRPYLNEETSTGAGVSTTTQTRSHQSTSTRGRTKDKRICQLNAAYKYCIHLEKTLKELYDKENTQVPDDCKLVHCITNLNLSRFDQSTNLNETNLAEQTTSTNNLYQTPMQKNNIHESSSLSSAVSSSTNTGTLNRRLKSSFKNLDASPILGAKSHYINDNDENTEFRRQSTSSRKRRLDDLSTYSNTSAKKAAVVDLNNNNSELSDMNLNTPSSTNNYNNNNISQTTKNSTSLANLTNTSTKNTNNKNSTNVEFRRHYFLRSTANRLKNALGKQTNTNQASHLQSPVATKLESSIMSSSRSSSLHTTPILRTTNNTGTSSDLSTASTASSLLDNLDHRQLLRVDMAPEEMNNLFVLNSKENVLNSKETFNFV